MVYQPELINALYPEASRTENSQTETLPGDHVYERSYRAEAGPVTEGSTTAPSLNTYDAVGYRGKGKQNWSGFLLIRIKIFSTNNI